MGISKPIHVKSVVCNLLNSHDGKCMSMMGYYIHIPWPACLIHHTQTGFSQGKRVMNTGIAESRFICRQRYVRIRVSMVNGFNIT